MGGKKQKNLQTEYKTRQWGKYKWVKYKTKKLGKYQTIKWRETSGQSTRENSGKNARQTNWEIPNTIVGIDKIVVKIKTN